MAPPVRRARAAPVPVRHTHGRGGGARALRGADAGPAPAPGARATLDALDELVAGSGGRVYLSKDARLRGGMLRAMYPQLDRFLAERRRVDPDGVLGSDLSRRAGLAEDGR